VFPDRFDVLISKIIFLKKYIYIYILKHFRIKNTLKSSRYYTLKHRAFTKKIKENEVEQCIDKHREQ
jgi:hypothetical protein